MLLNEHLMGKTILDMDGRRTEVVNDVHLLESKGRWFVVHVDISFNGFLRSWGLGWVHWIKDRFISWRYVQPLSLEDAVASDTVSLSITRGQIKELPSEDLADALEELSGKEQAAVFSLLDSEKAAETLMEAEPRASVRSSPVSARSAPEPFSRKCPPPNWSTCSRCCRTTTRWICSPCSPRTRRPRSRRSSPSGKSPPERLMSAGCVTMPKETTVGDALRHLRSSQFDHDMVSYIYITADPERLLMGVVDLRELVLAPDDATLGDLMASPVVAAEADDLKDDLAELFAKYHYRMIPGGQREGLPVGRDPLQGHYEGLLAANKSLGAHRIMPRIQTTRTVKIALIVLRIYLIVMLGLILFKFWKTWG